MSRLLPSPQRRESHGVSVLNNYRWLSLFDSVSRVLRAFTAISDLSALLSPAPCFPQGRWPLCGLPLENEEQTSPASESQRAEEDFASRFHEIPPARRPSPAASHPVLCVLPHRGLGKLQDKEPAEPRPTAPERRMGFFSCPQSSGCLPPRWAKPRCQLPGAENKARILPRRASERGRRGTWRGRALHEEFRVGAPQCPGGGEPALS